MKRIIKIFASILFIITVLTVYLTFDFAINNALSYKYSTDKYEHLHNDIKLKKISTLSLLKITRTNQTLKHNNDKQSNHIINPERRIRSLKDKQQQKPHLVKPAKFHKSKTGIKINQIKKPFKEQRKHLLTTKIIQHKDIKSKTNNNHL
ncbi:unnamed protein product [Rotaria sordida]|uniref:Uncharacterized protein n=1 Tax=Rotaria sordida TaxID=392033 RepID=A0A815D6E9_9BILA|nr:unnamed protein product [Rotaria sordida]CAF1293543.1 unnamed protein product [Rotaria sordida]